MPHSNCKPVCKFIDTAENRKTQAIHLDIKAARNNIEATKRLLERNDLKTLHKGRLQLEIELIQVVGYLNRCEEILKKW